MGKRLFVGNLPFTTTEKELNDKFSEFGIVTYARVIKDRDTGRLKGFGFVEFDSQEDADKALELNGADFNGRPLIVNEAREREARQ